MGVFSKQISDLITTIKANLVNADWNSTSGNSEILNKPTDLTDLALHNVTELSDVTNAGSGLIITTSERNDLVNNKIHRNTTSGNPHNVIAIEVPYDNSTTGLAATNVQDAIDEVTFDTNTSCVEYSIQSNSTDSTISTTNTPVKILGTTTVGEITNDFSHTSNRGTFDGTLTSRYKVDATLSVVRGAGSGNKFDATFYIAKNGTVVGKSSIPSEISDVKRPISLQMITELTNTDYIEIWVENNTNTRNVLVQFMNVNIYKI